MQSTAAISTPISDSSRGIVSPCRTRVSLRRRKFAGWQSGDRLEKRVQMGTPIRGGQAARVNCVGHRPRADCRPNEADMTAAVASASAKSRPNERT